MKRSENSARVVDLKPCLADPLLDVMNFLNEVVLDYPTAVSFAPGRPLDELFQVNESVAMVGSYVAATASSRGVSEAHVWQELGQYGRTNGFIAQTIAAHLEKDLQISVADSAIMVTVGAQEAMAVLLAGLFDPAHDVLLVSNPTYIGITGLARILGIRIIPVEAGDNGLEPHVVERTIVEASGSGRVRALYDIPDFNNPLGTRMSLSNRRRLIDVCRDHDVLIFEDNAYGMFAYDGVRLLPLKALDTSGTVVHIGSLSKTLFPGLRLGYLVADQHASCGATLAVALSRVKSLLTVNTPPLLQAIAADTIVRGNGSLESVVAPKRIAYRQQRDAMLGSLERCFTGWAPDVTWSSPAGGFFLTVTLPFPFGAAELRRCAGDHGVIVCPMQFYCLTPSRPNQIRLSFSYVTAEQIAVGIERLAGFVHAAIAAGPRV